MAMNSIIGYFLGVLAGFCIHWLLDNELRQENRLLRALLAARTGSVGETAK